MNIRKNFGDKVRSLRKKIGYSQEELGAVCGLHRTYIGIVERGEKNISLENIEKIAKALNVQPRELFEF